MNKITKETLLQGLKDEYNKLARDKRELEDSLRAINEHMRLLRLKIDNLIKEQA